MGPRQMKHPEISLINFYRKHTNLEGFEFYIFFPRNFSWKENDHILVADETAYETDQMHDENTPTSLYNDGYEFAFAINEIRVLYIDSWLQLGGEDSFSNFVRCMKHYKEMDSLLLP